MASTQKLRPQESLHLSWAARSTSARQPAPVKSAPGPVNIDAHFPPLPPKVTRESSPAPSSVSSNSEESICSVRPGHPMTLKQCLQNLKDFQIKMTLSRDTICFRWCDDREYNKETILFEGMDVVVKDVREFSEEGEEWYHIVRPAFGWINGADCVRKTTVQKRRKMKAVAQPVVAEAEKFPFLFGETVKCLDNGVWRVGTIQSTSLPVKVRFNGEKNATSVDISNISKVTATRSFIVVVENLPVRSQPNLKSFVSTRLCEGTKIEVVEFRGQYAKLNNPIGWIRCRTEFQLSILEPTYQPEIVLPTLTIKNLAEDVHAKSVVKCLETQLRENVNAFRFAGVRVNFTESKNGRKNCSLVFAQRLDSKIVLQYSLTEGFIFADERLDIAYDFAYMRKFSCPKDWCPETNI